MQKKILALAIVGASIGCADSVEKKIDALVADMREAGDKYEKKRSEVCARFFELSESMQNRITERLPDDAKICTKRSTENAEK